MIGFVLLLSLGGVLIHANKIQIVHPYLEGFDGKYQTADFGSVPYGRTTFGFLFFDEHNPDGCKPFSQSASLSADTTFVLVQRGNCTFVMKARNVQNAGGKITIVYDSRNEKVDEFIMVDDGTGSDISTPLLMISKSDGELLRSEIGKRSSVKFQIRVEFKVVNKKSTVSYNLYFSSQNQEIYNFLEDMAGYHERISQLVEFTPHYFTIACPYCASKYQERNCFNGGEYCSFSFNNDGVDVLREDLRQICIFKKDSDKWWDYMKLAKSCEFHNLSCRDQAQRDANLDNDSISKCFQSSFVNGRYDTTVDNTLLKLEREHWAQYANHFSPSITINNWQYRGDFKGADVFEAICATFSNPPEACFESLGIAVHTEKGMKVSVFWIVFTVIILVILNVVIVYCYRRHAKREMHDRLHHEVNSAVSAYFALSEGGAPSSSAIKD